MSFNTVVFLRGRREFLMAQTVVYESGSMKERCAQARLSEVCELLTILETKKKKGEEDGQKTT